MLVHIQEVKKSHYPLAIDTVYIGRPSKRYYCPCCEKEKRKLVIGFKRHDLKSNVHKQFDLNKAVCENCFNFEVYNDLMNEFYKTNIY